MLSLEQPMEPHTSELDPIYAQFRDQSRFWIQRVAVPLLMVIGLFGNLITVIIMTRRGMRSTTNMYLAALAFVDMLYLVLTFILGLSHYPNMAEYKYYAYWKLRPFLMMLTDACSNTSVWLTVTFTIERYIAVKYPMKGKVWCTEKRAKMLITCVFVFGILFAAPVPFEWKVIEKRITQQQHTPIATTRQIKTITDKEVLTMIPQNGSSLLTASKKTTMTNLASSASTTTTTMTTDGDVGVIYRNNSDNMNLSSIENLISIQTDNGIVENKNDTRILALDYSDFGRNETYKTFYYWSIAVIFYFVPLFSLMLFNGFLIMSVHQSKRERTRMTRRTINYQVLSPQQSTQRHAVIKETGKHLPAAMSAKVSSKNRNNQLVVTEPNRKKRSITNHKHKSFRILSACSSNKRKRNPSDNTDDSCANIIQQEKLHKCPLIDENTICITDGESVKPFNSVDAFSFVGGAEQPSAQQSPLTKAHQATPPNGDKLNGSKLVDEHSAVNIHITNEISENNVHINCDIDSTRVKDLKKEENKSKLKRRPTNLSEQSINKQRQQHINRGSRDSLQAKTRTGEVIPAKFTPAAKRSLPRLQSTSSFSSINNLQPSPSSSTHHQQQQTLTPASSQERRITIMLISVVILFLFCQIPSAAMLLYTSVREMVPNTNEHALVLAFGNIFNFLVAVNAAGNFILYSFLSKKYRRTFMILFCGCLGSKHKKTSSAPNRMMSVRGETSSGAQAQKSPSFYQNNKPSEKFRRDTLV